MSIRLHPFACLAVALLGALSLVQAQVSPTEPVPESEPLSGSLDTVAPPTVMAATQEPEAAEASASYHGTGGSG